MSGTKGRSGRPPIPTALHLVRGNPGRRPLNDREPKPPRPTRLPSPPVELSDAAKAEWRRTGRQLLEAGLLTNLDGPMLAALVVPLTRWLEMQALLAKSSVLLKKTDGTLYINPLVKIAKECQEQFMRALVEFGMSPSSRSRVHVEPVEQANPFDRFLEGSG